MSANGGRPETAVLLSASTVEAQVETVKLELGCGPAFGRGRRTPDTIGVDLRPPASVVADITKPLPFRDECFTHVFAQDVMEHVRSEDQFGLWNEIHRVLAPGGHFEGASPGADLNLNFAFRDPTHVFFFTAGTLAYFCATKADPLGELGFHYGRTGHWKVLLSEAIPHDAPSYYHWIVEKV